MIRRPRGLLPALGAAAVILLLAASASARPLYFENLTALYGFNPGDDLYACGVCHQKWEGTGVRNPYGTAVEQELYIGKTILDALADVEALDSDMDGFSNVDELTVHGTLPGFSCANYTTAEDTPPNFQSLITPFVASCLEPKDVLIEPASISFVATVGEVETVSVLIANNGTDDPIEVSSIALDLGTHPSITLVAPATPLSIPVGASELVDVVFEPLADTFTSSTLTITTDDPDEAVVEIDITAIGLTVTLAAPPIRAACLATVDKQFQKFTKKHVKEWTRCFVDEADGKACDAGRRDTKLQQAEEKLRSVVGGDKDRECAGNSLNASLLGLPATCGGNCSDIALTDITSFADCLVCRQEEASAAMLTAATGVTPPDLPESAPNAQAVSCQRILAKGVAKGIVKMQKELAACELANITAAVPVVCSTALASDLSALAAQVDQGPDRCKDSSGLQSCVYQMGADPTCLGDAATAIASDLVETTFGSTP